MRVLETHTHTMIYLKRQHTEQARQKSGGPSYVHTTEAALAVL